MTINSCTNYGGVHENDACFLVVQKKFGISPKIIKPSPGATAWLQLDPIPDNVNGAIKRAVTPKKEVKN